MRSTLHSTVIVGLLGYCCSAHAEWVATFYLGDSHTYDSSLRVIQPGTQSNASFNPVSWAPHPLGHGAPYYGLRIGWFPSVSSRVGVTFDFTHYKMYAETEEPTKLSGEWNGKPVDAEENVSAGIQSLEIAHGVNFASLNGQYRWNPNFDEGPWQTHVGAGLGVYVPQADGVINGVAVDGGYQYGGLGAQIFGGAEYSLPARWQPQILRWTLLVAGKADGGEINLSLDPNTRIETRVLTLHLIAGVSLHF